MIYHYTINKISTLLQFLVIIAQTKYLAFIN